VRRHRWISKILHGIGFVVGVFFILLAGIIWPDIFEGWMGYVVILGGIAVPMFVVQSFHVPAIDFTPSHDRLEFEFDNLEFATKFAQLNESTVK
jgi:hypothetical protein